MAENDITQTPIAQQLRGTGGAGLDFAAKGDGSWIEAISEIPGAIASDIGFSLQSIPHLPAAIMPSNGTFGFMDTSAGEEELRHRRRAIADAAMLLAGAGMGKLATTVMKGSGPSILRVLLGTSNRAGATIGATENVIFSQLNKAPDEETNLLADAALGAGFGVAATKVMSGLLKRFGKPATEAGKEAASEASERATRRAAEDLLARRAANESIGFGHIDPFPGPETTPAAVRLADELGLEQQLGLDGGPAPLRGPLPQSMVDDALATRQNEVMGNLAGALDLANQMDQVHASAVDENALREAAGVMLSTKGRSILELDPEVVAMSKQITAERLIDLSEGNADWFDDAARRAAAAVSGETKSTVDILKGDFILPGRDAVRKSLHAEASQHAWGNRNERLKFASDVLGRPVTTFSDINGLEAVNVINAMRARRGLAPIIPPRVAGNTALVKLRGGNAAVTFIDDDHKLLYNLPERLGKELVDETEVARLAELIGVPPEGVPVAARMYRDFVETAARVNGPGRLEIPSFADFMDKLPDMVVRSRNEVLASVTNRTAPREAAEVGRAGRRATGARARTESEGTVASRRRGKKEAAAAHETLDKGGVPKAGEPDADVVDVPDKPGETPDFSAPGSPAAGGVTRTRQANVTPIGDTFPDATKVPTKQTARGVKEFTPEQRDAAISKLLGSGLVKNNVDADKVAPLTEAVEKIRKALRLDPTKIGQGQDDLYSALFNAFFKELPDATPAQKAAFAKFSRRANFEELQKAIKEVGKDASPELKKWAEAAKNYSQAWRRLRALVTEEFKGKQNVGPQGRGTGKPRDTKPLVVQRANVASNWLEVAGARARNGWSTLRSGQFGPLSITARRQFKSKFVEFESFMAGRAVVNPEIRTQLMGRAKRLANEEARNSAAFAQLDATAQAALVKKTTEEKFNQLMRQEYTGEIKRAAIAMLADLYNNHHVQVIRATSKDAQAIFKWLEKEGRVKELPNGRWALLKNAAFGLEVKPKKAPKVKGKLTVAKVRGMTKQQQAGLTPKQLERAGTKELVKAGQHPKYPDLKIDDPEVKLRDLDAEFNANRIGGEEYRTRRAELLEEKRKYDNPEDDTPFGGVPVAGGPSPEPTRPAAGRATPPAPPGRQSEPPVVQAPSASPSGGRAVPRAGSREAINAQLTTGLARYRDLISQMAESRDPAKKKELWQTARTARADAENAARILGSDTHKNFLNAISVIDDEGRDLATKLGTAQVAEGAAKRELQGARQEFQASKRQIDGVERRIQKVKDKIAERKVKLADARNVRIKKTHTDAIEGLESELGVLEREKTRLATTNQEAKQKINSGVKSVTKPKPGLPEWLIEARRAAGIADDNIHAPFEAARDATFIRNDPDLIAIDKADPAAKVMERALAGKLGASEYSSRLKALRPEPTGNVFDDLPSVGPNPQVPPPQLTVAGTAGIDKPTPVRVIAFKEKSGRIIEVPDVKNHGEGMNKLQEAGVDTSDIVSSGFASEGKYEETNLMKVPRGKKFKLTAADRKDLVAERKIWEEQRDLGQGEELLRNHDYRNRISTLFTKFEAAGSVPAWLRALVNRMRGTT